MSAMSERRAARKAKAEAIRQAALADLGWSDQKSGRDSMLPVFSEVIQDGKCIKCGGGQFEKVIAGKVAAFAAGGVLGAAGHQAGQVRCVTCGKEYRRG